MDGSGDYHTKWSKSDRERQIPYNIICMWNLKKKKKIQMNLFTKQNRLTDIEKQIYGYQREKAGKG